MLTGRGPYIDSHWGHYQSVQVIELGMSLGYEDSALDDENLYALIQAYNDNVGDIVLAHKDGSPLELNEKGYSVAECVYETADEVIDWINKPSNNLVPKGHWFGHHPDLGDVGVWSVHADCTPTWCEAACEPNSRCPEFHKEQEDED